MMLGHDGHAQAEFDALGPGNKVRDEHIVRRDRLPFQSQVMATPRFRKAQLLGEDNELGILVKALSSRLLRRMKRHVEGA